MSGWMTIHRGRSWSNIPWNWSRWWFQVVNPIWESSTATPKHSGIKGHHQKSWRNHQKITCQNPWPSIFWRFSLFKMCNLCFTMISWALLFFLTPRIFWSSASLVGEWGCFFLPSLEEQILATLQLVEGRKLDLTTCLFAFLRVVNGYQWEMVVFQSGDAFCSFDHVVPHVAIYSVGWCSGGVNNFSGCLQKRSKVYHNSKVQPEKIQRITLQNQPAVSKLFIATIYRATQK